MTQENYAPDDQAAIERVGVIVSEAALSEGPKRSELLDVALAEVRKFDDIYFGLDLLANQILNEAGDEAEADADIELVGVATYLAHHAEVDYAGSLRQSTLDRLMRYSLASGNVGAAELMGRILGRNLTGGEVMALVDKYVTSGQIRASDERFYLGLARAQRQAQLQEAIEDKFRWRDANFGLRKTSG